MQKSPLLSLSSEWQKWIADNLARDCEPGEMAQLMVRDGRFDSGLAYAAISEARYRKFGGVPDAAPLAPLPLAAFPDIDNTANRIVTSDREVDIVLTLKAPRLVVLANVLSDEECAALIDYSHGRLERSPVVDDQGSGHQVHADRTSRGAMLQRDETELITRIDTRLAELARWPVHHGEGLQVLRYGASNEYRAHFDWFDATLPGPRKHMAHGGQRLATFVLYLSDVERGGGTSFPVLGLEVAARKGGAVFFANTDHFATPDRKTLHAGLPVVQGVKYVANKWLRATKY